MNKETLSQYELMVGGSGGQGVLLIGKMLAEAALSKYKNSLFFPNYGAQMRAGPSECTVIFSDEEICSPALLKPEVGIGLDPLYMDILGKRIKPGGTLLTESTNKSSGFKRDDINIFYLPANQTALEHGNLQSANFAFIGAYLELTKAVSLEMMEKVIVKKFQGGKNKSFIESNVTMMKEGAKLFNQLRL